MGGSGNDITGGQDGARARAIRATETMKMTEMVAHHRLLQTVTDVGR